MYLTSLCSLLILCTYLKPVFCTQRIVKYYPHIQKNAINHNTIKYETIKEGSGKLVLRRGQVFIIEFELKQPFDENSDDFVVIATPTNPRSKTYKAEPEFWLFQWDYTKSFIVDIFIPANASIGRWNLKCILKKQDSNVAHTYNIVEEEIIILFNAWNEGLIKLIEPTGIKDLINADDPVFLLKEKERAEYVLNDVGDVYMGHPKRRYSKPWYFGQFEHNTFMAVLYIIEKYGLSVETRRNVVAISRAFTSLVNSNDNLGVLVGRWDGKYDPYKHPMSWISSGPILEEYQRTGLPVRYGQCWVYAGVLTTMCRAVGIPSRPITDFGSAHDKNRNLVIDKYFKKVNGKHVEIMSELIWNFHVWNEAWMKREDLKNPEYDGWQMIDGTPQEISHGLYRCGPAPPKLVKYGEMKVNYDSPFLYSEVNADIVNWLEDQTNKKLTKMSVNKIIIGQSILTKSIDPIKHGNTHVNYEDIVDTYKFREGSKEERQYYIKAAKTLNLTDTLALLTEVQGRAIRDEIILNVTLLTPSEPLIGHPLKFNITIKNKKSTKLPVYVSVNVSSLYYYGMVAKSILQVPSLFFNLEPKQTKYYDVDLHVSDYLDKLVDFAMVKVDVLAHGKKREDFWHEERSIQFEKPKLDVVILGDAVKNEPITLDIKFTNPLNQELTKCTLQLDGQGLESKPITIGTIEAKQRYHTIRTVTSNRKGKLQFLFNMNCHELHDILANMLVPVN